MLHVEQHGKDECRLQVLLAANFADAQQKQTEQNTVVLKVNVIDEEQTDMAEQQSGQSTALVCMLIADAADETFNANGIHNVGDHHR